MRLRTNSQSRGEQAFTLAEVVIASAIAALSLGSVIYGYVMAAQRAEWAAYSAAAQSLAMQKMEQFRAAKWDPNGFPPVDQLVASNFPVEINILDIPISGTNIVYATNFSTITQPSTNPPVKMIRVFCVWNFMGKRNFTNSISTYRAPDQ